MSLHQYKEAGKLLSRARSRCKHPSPRNTKYYIGKGIKCLLSIKDVKFLWDRDNAKDLKKPSLDRIESNKNYAVDNCRFIEWERNRDGRVYFKNVSERKVYVVTTVSLNETDLKKVNALKKKGFKIIDIFRAGLEDVQARSPKRLF